MIADATAKVADADDLLSDLIASSDYRSHLCTVLARRALLVAAKNAT
jgi:carbon-monoxide dehydrogenase medium subunit